MLYLLPPSFRPEKRLGSQVEGTSLVLYRVPELMLSDVSLEPGEELHFFIQHLASLSMS